MAPDVQYLSMGLDTDFERFHLKMASRGYSLKAVLHMWQDCFAQMDPSDWDQCYRAHSDQFRLIYRRDPAYNNTEDDLLYYEAHFC